MNEMNENKVWQSDNYHGITVLRSDAVKFLVITGETRDLAAGEAGDYRGRLKPF